MADQRPTFRFRLPWLPAAQPPPRPSVPRPPAQPAATTTPATRTPQTNPPQPTPSQPTTTPTSQTVENQVPTPLPATVPTGQTGETESRSESNIAPNPSPTTATTTTQSAETQNPVQPPTSTTSPQTAERPPFRPPGLAPSPAPAPSPQSQTPRTQSKLPPSPSRATVQPRVPSPSASPNRAAAQSRTPSQPSTPPRATPQPRAVSQPSSPARRSPQLPSAPRTSTQRSPSLPGVGPSEQKSSPSSPSRSNARVKTTPEFGKQPTSPSRGERSLPKVSSQPPESPSYEVASTSDIQHPKSATSEIPSQALSSKAEIISEEVTDPHDRAPLEIGSQLNEMKKHPSEESRDGVAKTHSPMEGPEKAEPTQTSHNSTTNPEPESPKELKPEETMEVKEVMQGTIDNAQEEARNKTNAFQSEPTLKTVSRKDITETSASNGRHTKITTAHPKNNSLPGDNRHKHPMSNGQHVAPLHKEIREDISKLVNKMAAGESKEPIEDRPVSIVTLAGENRGATMHVGSDSSRKEGAIHIHRGYKIKPDGSPEGTTDGEEGFKAKQSDHLKPKEDQAPEAYVNSNVQAINNSIMLNSSITEGNPGVHLVRSTFPTESKTPSAKPELLDTRKAEFNTTPSWKLTHEPVVRRRCLRGLFLESSDSDMDSTKPRSHGCRVACNEKRKGNDIDVL
ncbi:OLC1v1018000C1 [Oldenlandia corymbosa var. corymbosa]|uniref:OLC1v1018000C1 n=1 Tax=Oldenlandia corymbosa var. corymbosa TaxID=529605 RepID=A0AAV1EAN4_OLDCO|nr:OLC1v1018000C1 [Oldenlandia corymbosa var. corymbosa]